ncbi:MAG: hypothetical protein ACREQQ_07215 [Candidatus Binatia bacterium]
MRTHRLDCLRGTGLALSSLLLLALARPGLAQVDEGFSAQNFQPPIDSFGYVTMNGARHLRAGHPFAAAYVDWSNNPLDLRDINEGFIDRMTFVHGVASIGVVNFLENGGISLGAVVQYAAEMDGIGRDPGTTDPAFVTPPAVELPDGRLADTRVETKITFLDREKDPIGIALRGWGVIPTGEDKYFLSNDEHFGGGGGLILEKDFGGFRIGAEGAYEWIEGDVVISEVEFVDTGIPGISEGTESEKLRIDDKLHMKLGVAKELFVDDFWFVVEATHWARALHVYNTTRESPAEIGAALRFDRHVLILVGASAGVNDGVGAPDVRGFASLGFRF